MIRALCLALGPCVASKMGKLLAGTKRRACGRADLGMSEDSSAAQDSESSRAHTGLALAASSDVESEHSEGQDQEASDCGYGLGGRLAAPRPLPYSSLAAAADGVNLSNVEVTRQDALAIKRLYPLKAGAQIVLPSRVAFERDRAPVLKCRYCSHLCQTQSAAH